VRWWIGAALLGLWGCAGVGAGDREAPAWPPQARLEATVALGEDGESLEVALRWSQPPWDDGVLAAFELVQGERVVQALPADVEVVEVRLPRAAGRYDLHARDSAGRRSAQGLALEITEEQLAALTLPAAARLNAIVEGLPARGPAPAAEDEGALERLMDALKRYDERPEGGN
jgi:hypothetical protein